MSDLWHKCAKMTKLERNEATVYIWTIVRSFPAGSLEYSFTGQDFSGDIAGNGAVEYGTREEALAALPAAQAIADALYPDDDLARRLAISNSRDSAASLERLKHLRSAARRAAKATLSQISAALAEEYPTLRGSLPPLPGIDATLDDLRSYPAQAVERAASRISEAYGLGLGSDWAQRHFGMDGDETAALAGHVGKRNALRMTGRIA